MHGSNRTTGSNRLAQRALTRRSIIAGTPAVLFAHAVRAQDQHQPLKGRKGQILVGLTQEPTVFNPLMPRLEVDQGVWFGLFNPLWRIDPDGSFVPELAAEVPSLENGGISADGLTWTVKLREGVKWHDGTEFTAEDVKYTLALLNNPSFRAYTRQGHSLVKDVMVTGRYEVTWKMARAYAPYLSLLTWTFMVPKHILSAAADPNTAPFNFAPVGTGPFKWGQRIAGESVTLIANPAYFGDGPYVERVIYNYAPDLNVSYTQFRTGQIDYIGYYGIPAQDFKEAKTLPDREIFVTPSAEIECVILNFGRPIFQDKAVRQALYSGINKKAIIDIIYYGIPTTTESFLPRSSWAFNSDLPTQAYDLAAGNQTLEAAGWIKGSDGIRAKDGNKLEFTVATASGNPQREQILQMMQQDWRKLGVSMQIKTMPSAVVYSDYYTKSQFDCMLLSSTFGTAADPDPTQRFSSTAIPVQGGSGLNFYQYKNAEVDRLLQVGQVSFKREERRDAYRRIQSIVREDLVFLPLNQTTPVEGTKAKLVGFRSNPNVSVNSWNIGSWRWQS